MQLFMGFIDEMRSPSEFFRGKGANAEVVVIANVCEQGVAGCSLRYGPESDKVGRVIFYSNGVKAKQYLNFSYLPVYGPIKYQGGPLMVQVSILELDNSSEQQKKLLNTLAEVGKKAYPPASPALSVLDNVGTSLMAGSSDDVVFRYTMSLVPGSSKLNYHSPIIAEGNYAFIRKNTSKGDLEKEVINELKFDNLTGRLVQVCTKKSIGILTKDAACTLDINTGTSFKDYRDNTYLSFQVKSGFSESTLDNIQSFESLLNEINVEKDSGALKVIESLSILKEEISQNSYQNKLLKQLEGIKKILLDTSKDNLNIFNNQVFKFYTEYNQQINLHIKEKCTTENISLGICKLLITPEQLIKVQSDVRLLLNLIHPTVEPATYIPSENKTLNENFRTIFTEGYKLNFNDFIFKSYLNRIESIKNLESNIYLLKKDNVNSEYITARKVVLRNELELFLDELSKDLTLREAFNCNTITSGTCYRYLSEPHITEVTNIFNQFAINDGLKQEEKLTSSAKSSIENLSIINSLKILH